MDDSWRCVVCHGRADDYCAEDKNHREVWSNDLTIHWMRNELADNNPDIIYLRGFYQSKYGKVSSRYRDNHGTDPNFLLGLADGAFDGSDTQ